MADINEPIVDDYLQSLHYQLWSIWNVGDPRQRATAAQWLMTELNNIVRFQTEREATDGTDATNA